MIILSYVLLNFVTHLQNWRLHVSEHALFVAIYSNTYNYVKECQMSGQLLVNYEFRIWSVPSVLNTMWTDNTAKVNSKTEVNTLTPLVLFSI